MRVFNACLKVIKRHSGALATYLVIFVTLCAMMSFAFSDTQSAMFEPSRAKVAVIDRDGGSALIAGLTSYLDNVGQLVELPDEPKALMDALFYHDAHLILVVPQGFTAAFEAGEPVKLAASTVPDAAQGAYAQMLVSQYLSTARLYLKNLPGLSGEQLSAYVAEDLSRTAQVVLRQFGSVQPVDESLEVYFRMMGYIMMVLMVLLISTIMMVFNRPSLRLRNLCAPIGIRSMNAQLALCAALMGGACYLALMALGAAMYAGAIRRMDPRSFALLAVNALALMALCLSVGFLCGSFTRSSNAQSALANILSLGFGFLGGVFVPQAFMGESILAFARFTPLYWYVSAVEAIGDLTRFDVRAVAPVLVDMGVLLGFAAAIFSVALLVSRVRRQSAGTPGRDATEMDF